MNTMVKNIKTIVFDFGKVLANFDHMEICVGLAKFSTHTPEGIYQRIFSDGIEKQYDEGKITSHEFYHAVMHAVSANSNLDFETFARIWEDIFTPNEGIENILEKISPSSRLILLSNTNELHWEHISGLPLIKKFFNDEDRLVLSFEYGFRKPDERIFHEAIKKAGCAPDEILYIDDIAEYVNAFSDLGASGIVYDCNKDSITVLDEGLSAFGIFK